MSSEQAGGTPGSAAVSDRMRALLSRAAEEQLLEQRQVSAVLGELRALVADVDERLATGEQVERVAAEVRALSARVEARLDATEARSAELAERVEARLSELTAGLTASVERSERRLAAHVDDAVLALAEVVLRRRSTQGVTAAASAPKAAAGDGDDPVVRAAVGDAPVPEAPSCVTEDAGTASPSEDTSTEQDELAPPPGPTEDTDRDAAASDDVPPPLVDPDADGRAAAELGPPGEGFVLVPADVEEPDAAPAPPVQQERRTAERRTSDRGDGSGRRRRPWWRPV